MPALHRIAGGLRALFRRHHVDESLHEELHAYLAAAIEDRMRAGATREEATRAAHREMGSLAAIQEHTRDAGWESSLDAAWRDLRYAARTLRRAPLFAAVAIATLTVGIGANTAVFSVVNAIMLRPLPLEEPEDLVALAAAYGDTVDPAFSYSAFRQFAQDGRRFIDPVAASRADRVAITIDGLADAVSHKRVSGNYFTALGVRPELGRTLLPADELPPAGQPVAVISHAYWAGRMQRNPSIIGQRVRLNGTPLTIVGVLSPTFVSESAGEAPEIWTPLPVPASPPWIWTGHSTTWLRILARRQPGVTLDQARVGLQPVYGRIKEEMAREMSRPEFRQAVRGSQLQVAAAPGGSPRVRDAFGKPLQVLMAVVGLVLVIACANVATLVLARSAGRRREIAICLAIGAGRGRLVRRLVAEAMLLAAMGAIGGLLLAFSGTTALATIAAQTALSLSLDLAPDVRVLIFTVVVTICAVVLFGLLPALRASRIDPLPAIMNTDRPLRGTLRVPLGRTLVVSQIAVAIVLLVVAGLFVRSLMQLNDVETGFDPDGVLIVQLTPVANTTPGDAEQRRTAYRQMLERAESIPGVLAASVSFTGLFNEGTWGNAITVEGFTSPNAAPPRTFANAVSHRYFDVVGLTIRRGRVFHASDHETAPGVAIVNDTFARRFFGAADPIGKHVGLGTPAREMLEIVGVVENAKYVALREDDRPMLYVPFAQYDATLRTMEVRTAGSPGAVIPTLRRQLATVDPRLAVLSIVEFRDQIDASIAAERLVARLSAGFGLIALALAAIGLYGLVAYVTAERTGEIGIRMALGGGRRQVQWLVIRQVVLMVASGAAIGLPLALGGARLMDDLLYRVAPTDPLVVAAGLSTLIAAATIASYVPVRRAARVDPAVALRCE